MSTAFRAAWRPLALAAALAAVSASSQAANLFANAGFETGTLAGWSSTGGSVTNSDAHTGSFSFAGFSSDNVSQGFAPTATADITELSFWGKRSGGLFDLVTLSYSDSSQEDVLVNTLGKGDDWTYVNLTAQLDAGKSLTNFFIYGTSPGPALLDDFKLDATLAVPEPSTYALMALGIGFFARRRKA